MDTSPRFEALATAETSRRYVIYLVIVALSGFALRIWTKLLLQPIPPGQKLEKIVT
jgi:hypothetical protein